MHVDADHRIGVKEHPKVISLLDPRRPNKLRVEAFLQRRSEKAYLTLIFGERFTISQIYSTPRSGCNYFLKAPNNALQHSKIQMVRKASTQKYKGATMHTEP